MGGGRLSVVGEAEGAAAPVDAMDPETLWTAGGGREGVVEDQPPTDRSATESGQDTEAAPDIRANQAGLSAQAPHSGEDGSLGCAESGIYGGRSGLSFREFRQWRVRTHAQRHGYSHHLDRIGGGVGTWRAGCTGGLKRDLRGVAVSAVRSGFGQRIGVHQLASEALVRAEGDSTDAGKTLQERRQRAHRAEELDACPEASGLGAL